MQAKSGFDASNFIDYGRKVSSPKVKNDIRGTLLDHMTLQLERWRLNFAILIATVLSLTMLDYYCNCSLIINDYFQLFTACALFNYF